MNKREKQKRNELYNIGGIIITVVAVVVVVTTIARLLSSI